MKKLFILYLSLILAIMLTLTGCGGNPPDTADGGSLISAITDNTQSADTENPTQSQNEDVSSTSESTAESQNTTGGKKTETSNPTGNSSKPSNSDNSSSQPPANTESVSPPPTPESSNDNTVKPVNAKAADAKDIAEKILKYINQYRVAQGAGEANNLPGLTQVAQYRSNQLITNYAHDTNDEREATRAFKYGEHVVYDDGAGFKLDYYNSHAGEAIGRSGGNAPVDEIAQRMADGFKNSAAHWSYVGAARNIYLSIGASYGNGQWYICILTSEVDLTYKP